MNLYLDPSGNTAFVAEAGGLVSCVKLSTSSKTRVGKPASAPITSLTSYGGKVSAEDATPSHYIFAGGWDKTISTIKLGSQRSGAPTASSQSSFKAHADFVKCLSVAQTPDKKIVVLSGGADGDLCIWSIDGQRLARLKPKSRGIECITLDPLSTPESPQIFFSTSQREIFSFTLPKSTEMTTISLSEPIIQHETSVYKLCFDNDGDLWTCSADKSAKRLVRENGYVADTILAHPDFVRDIIIHETAGLAITACRDEEVRVWSSSTSQLLHTFSGHYEEVTGLAITGNTLVSISIDATLRRWSLAPQDLQKAIEEVKKPKTELEPEIKNDFGLTEEEEAELRAMMEDEEADVLDKMARDEQ